MFDIKQILDLAVLGPWMLSMLFGLIIGATPGLTATMAVALIVPVTYYMPPLAGLSMVLGVSAAAIFAGDIPATYLRIPGTPASAAAVLDSYEMAKRGNSGLPLSLDLYCSAIGGMIGVLCLIFTAPMLAGFALRFTHFQYFWLGVFGLSMSAILCQGNAVMGVLSATLGVLLSTIGTDLTSGHYRFVYGVMDLADGVSFIPVMIGMFGVSEVLKAVAQPGELSATALTGSTKLPPTREVFTVIWKHKLTVLRSAILGTVIGALPGAGGDVAAWVSYGAAKKLSKTPEKFGQGCEEGVIAPTSANNAAIGGAWIPALVFGIPGDSITAIVLGAMIMYGLQPGPMIFQARSEMVRGIFTIAFISQIMLIPIGFIGIKLFRQILRMPKNIVFVLVLLFSVVGSYAMRSNYWDVGIMLAAGILGFIMNRLDIPQAPLILGLILGNMVENNFRIGMLKSGGDYTWFINDPICATLIALIFLTYFSAPVYRLIKRLLGYGVRR
ncbi:MAG: tripartite tricarboxylate transporter permease [Synergistaceae bacterium]|nr:tripartite tricarboxylate transporter permease [Synergistaceae bacterium]